MKGLKGSLATRVEKLLCYCSSYSFSHFYQESIHPAILRADSNNSDSYRQLKFTYFMEAHQIKLVNQIQPEPIVSNTQITMSGCCGPSRGVS